MDLYYQSFSFLQLFWQFFAIFYLFWAVFGPPPLKPIFSQTCLYDTWPLVPFFICGISQKMDRYYQSFSFLQLFWQFFAIFDLFLGCFWPPLRPRVSQTCLYEAWALGSFFDCRISQKVDLIYQLLSFVPFLFPSYGCFWPFLGCFWPHLRPRVFKTFVYEAWPLVSSFDFGTSQKTDLIYQFFPCLTIISSQWSNLALFLVKSSCTMLAVNFSLA